MTEDEAKLYELPYAHVRESVLPFRKHNRRKAYRERWWLYQEARVGLREAKDQLSARYIVTPRVAKFRVFVWVGLDIMANDACVSIVREDDYFFGVLHSALHESWARRAGTQLREAESGSRYTPTSTFETFPFAWPPGQEPAEDEDDRVAAIAQAARDLVTLRQGWLHPPAEEISVTISERMLKRRTLTNLYNALVHYRNDVKGRRHNPGQWDKDVKGIISLDKIEELDYIHCQLDRAVLDAYGWPHDLTDEQILERLLALNLERAAKQEA
jgi:hypothetical protein